MRRSLRTIGLLIGGAGLAAFAREARAQQIDVNPPLPNVLILLDNSGSMEKMIDGTDPGGPNGQGQNQACTYKYVGGVVNTVGNPAVGSSPNRWGIATQALTGDLYPHYTCVEMPRDAASTLVSEYKIANKAPYDVDYVLPYHRPVAAGDVLANSCVVAPGGLPGAPNGQGVGPTGVGLGGFAADFPPASIKDAKLIDRTQACTFSQTQNGILDSAKDMIRFGFMTFDPDTTAGTGVTIGPLNALSVTPTPTSNFDGMWSYFDTWLNAGGGVQGKPADCATLSPFEVGARNPAAPPWEGRFVMLPSDPNATVATVEAQNEQIQRVILGMRPYGATPIAGMMDDARHYYWNDPVGPQGTDPYLIGGAGGNGCRDEYIILLTDGAPNLDLRPACANTPNDPNKPGQCPYPAPEVTAATLAAGGPNRHPVKTFVIGFAVSSNINQNNIDCSSLNTNGTLSQQCANVVSSDPIAPCCLLQSIAIQGGTKGAYFADTPGDLQKALGAIIAQIAQNQTTRTVPAYSPVVATPGDPSAPYSAMFLSSFSPIPGKAWAGSVQRQRFQCTLQGGNYIVPPPVVDTTQGDDFAYNLNLPGAQANRHFRTVLASSAPAIDSSATIRPNFVGNADRWGAYGGTQIGGTPVDVKTSLGAACGANACPPTNITNSSCPNQSNTQWLTPLSCQNLALNYTMAEATTDAMPNASFAPFLNRVGYAMGDIFHAMPQVVPRPMALIRDESYGTFAELNKNRRTVLYAATNDGLLHAFDANVKTADREKGELWSFILPAGLPKLLSTYPASHQLLLDGSPLVKDVVFDRFPNQLSGAACTAQSCPWHSVLVAGYGSGAQGYYALDVTDPEPSNDMTKGPKFLWQLTKTPNYNNVADRQLFGAKSATPAITTVFIRDNSGAHEVGVAILPGGAPGNGAGNGACQRHAAQGDDAAPNGGYTRRSHVRCWGQQGGPNDPVAGRSVAVVRLDTGEIIRAFGLHQDLPQSLIDANRVGLQETPLDSPMTGIPVVFPGQTGSLAQKVYIGDADGTVWRFDFTSSDPQEWKGELFLDAYNTQVYVGNNGGGLGTGNSWLDGQPIQLEPIVSIDRLGRTVLHFATGDQESYTTTGTNFLYSLTETVQNGKLRANVNWYQRFDNGERVSGPMAIFDSVAYFATFAAGANAQSCSGGVAKLWGRDFVLPKTSNDLSQGGVPRLQPPVNPPPQPPDFIDPSTYDPNTAGKLIPGVSVNVSPACAATSTTNDAYTGGAHTQFSNVTPGQYSLYTQVGGKANANNGASTGTFKVDLPPPRTASIIDAWASVVE